MPLEPGPVAVEGWGDLPEWPQESEGVLLSDGCAGRAAGLEGWSEEWPRGSVTLGMQGAQQHHQQL